MTVKCYFLPPSVSPGFIYNLGVPLDQLDRDSPLQKTYRRVGFDAWRLSEGMGQGVELEKALSWIREIKDQELPSEDQSLVQLCTEAGAAIVSCLVSPDMPPGMYGLIDIGAWTTDISFFRRVALTIVDDGILTLEFYAAETHRVAVNDVDERALRGLLDLWDSWLTNQPRVNPPLSVTTMRSQREAGQFGTKKFFIDMTDRIPTKTTLLFARECIRERLLAGFRKTLVQAREREPHENAFRGFPIFVTGGGAAEKILWADIAKQTPVSGSIKKLRPLGLVGNIPIDVEQRYVVATGLAIPVPLWPRIFMPSQGGPVPPQPPPALPTPEELGYEEP